MMSSDVRCTLCLRWGHRASHCPERTSLVLARAVGTFLGHLAGRALRFVIRHANRLVCHTTACKQVFRHNLQGRHDQKPHGVWECQRCGRVRLGKPIPEHHE